MASQSSSGGGSGSGSGRPPGMLSLVPNLQNTRYDEAEFIVGGRGVGKGELESMTFKIHEGYAAEIHKWIKSGLFPYKTETDLIRHALVRHLRLYLPLMEGEVEGTLMHELAQIDEDAARWAFQNRFVKHIENIAERVNETLQMPNGRFEVERMLRGYRKRIESTKHSFFKGVYQKMFDDRFGAYLSRIALLETNVKEEPPDLADVLQFELPDLDDPEDCSGPEEDDD